MTQVTVRFVGGPADGASRPLPADSSGRPPSRWILTAPTRFEGAEHVTADHLYERDDHSDPDGWLMRFVRSDPVGMTE